MDSALTRQFASLSTQGKCLATYIWFSSKGAALHEATRVLSARPDSVHACPLWNTLDMDNSLLMLQPCSLHADPIRSVAQTHGDVHYGLWPLCIWSGTKSPAPVAGAGRTSWSCAARTRPLAPRTLARLRTSCTRIPATTGLPAIAPCVQPRPVSPCLAVSSNTLCWTPRRTGPSVRRPLRACAPSITDSSSVYDRDMAYFVGRLPKGGC